MDYIKNTQRPSQVILGLHLAILEVIINLFLRSFIGVFSLIKEGLY